MSSQCRLCGDTIYTKGALNIFNGSKQIIVQIALLTGIWLKDQPNMPRKMCSCCLLSLKSAIAFREVCIKTNKRLSNTVKSVRTKEEEEEDLDDVSNPLEVRHTVSTIKKDVKEEEDDVYMEEEFIEDLEDDLYATDSQEDNEEKPEEDDKKILKEEEETQDEEALEDFEDDEEWTQGDEENSDTQDDSGDDSDTEATIKSLVSEVVGEEHHEGIPNGHSSNALKKSRNNENSPSERNRKKYKSSKVFVCDHCGRKFNDKGNLNLHVLRHTGVKPFECPECGQREFNKYILNIHIRVKHRGEKPYACKYCNAQFESSTKRTRHERRTHIVQPVKQKPFKCSSCDLRFEIRSQRTKHEKIHSGIREFQCKVCKVAFTRASNLKIHCKSKQHQRKELEFNSRSKNKISVK
ncbi:zinc finger protein 568 [Drosophila biarmipes]|uniref:zinc finger protein 568 n=1 Tax=Drosophila biarmipes TaxID=125945 RepID=UPI0007E7681C|nr:zinc finger protein 568 [Drosophila biarmipes]